MRIMASAPRKSLMRNLGGFFGHIVRGVKSDVRPERTVLRTTVEQEPGEIDGQKVTLRRTTIEEIEVEPETNDPPPESRE